MRLNSFKSNLPDTRLLAGRGFPFSLGGEVNMDRNLACVEVKPCGAGVEELREDLLKLTWFCRNARYHRGIFLVYGMKRGETPEYVMLREKLRRASEGNGGIDMARISLFTHAAVGRPAERVNP